MCKMIPRALLILRVAFLWVAVAGMGIAVRSRPACIRMVGYAPFLLGALLAFAAGHLTGVWLLR
jgi:hypothetical protein